MSMVVHGMDLPGISGGEFYPGTSISIVWSTGSRELLRTVVHYVQSSLILIIFPVTRN